MMYTSRTLLSTYHQLYRLDIMVCVSIIASANCHELYHQNIKNFVNLNITNSHCRCGRSLRTWFATTLALLLSLMSSTLLQVFVIYVHICIYICMYMHVYKYAYISIQIVDVYRFICLTLAGALGPRPSTGWQKWIACLLFIGLFPQKSPMISGSFAKKGLQPWHPSHNRHTQLNARV